MRTKKYAVNGWLVTRQGDDYNNRPHRLSAEKDRIMIMDVEQVAGYRVDEFGALRNAPCACPQCQEDGWQRGHPYCNNVPAELLKARDNGLIFAHLDSGGWYWSVTALSR